MWPQKTIIELVDDLDNSPGEETIHFTWEGRPLVIDLGKKNADKLRKAIEPFVAAARPDETVQEPAPRRGRPAGATSKRGAPSGQPTAVIRAWARENNVAVPDRGRLKPEVVAAWEAAGKPGA